MVSSRHDQRAKNTERKVEIMLNNVLLWFYNHTKRLRMIKKNLSLLLAIALLFSICCPAHAVFSDASGVAVTSALNEIITREYLSLEIADRSEWLSLEDINGSDFAFFIPLKRGNVIGGYSVVSHIGGVPRVLKTAFGSASEGLAAAIILTESNGNTNRIIYDFPDAFLAECDGKYYKICTTGDLELANVREYGTITAEFFKEANQTSQKDADCQVQLREEITYAQLDDSAVGAFIPIPKTGGYYYGGQQQWLTDEGVSQFYANRSCGVTAAANVLYYMATHVSGKSALYNQTGSLTKAKFSAFQKTIFNYLDPSIFGIPFESEMAVRVVNYAGARGVSLSAVNTPATWTQNSILTYMQTGLNAESPILVLNWNSPISGLTRHWVTVTKIYADNVSMYMVTSNWGDRVTYDFSTWVNSSSVNKAALYFV